MSELISPVNQQMVKLNLTPEERGSLFNNFVIAAKTYSKIDEHSVEMAMPTYYKLNLEVLFLKFVEANTVLLNTYGHTRDFMMFRNPQKTTEECLLILNNGIAVRGYINYHPEGEVDMPNTAVYRILNDGVEAWHTALSNDVVIMNTNVHYALADVPVLELTHIQAVENVLVLDAGRMRNIAKRNDAIRSTPVRPVRPVQRRNKPQ